jgi:hypothetical protein
MSTLPATSGKPLAISRATEVAQADPLIDKFYAGTITLDELAVAVMLKWFRLNCFYYIKIKKGTKVKFRANAEQRKYYVDGHNRDVILKARQLGFTTFKMLSSLDSCLFNKDFSAGVICHSLLDAADIFRNKIKYAYEHLRKDSINKIFATLYATGRARALFQLPRPLSDKNGAYVFDNDSAIRVGTSYRGGTLQALHVSEFGKICRKYPEKAVEIVTGAFEAVGIDGEITLESTAEGKAGEFYDIVQDSRKMADMGKDPTRLDFKFHFFSWWENPEYSTDEAVQVPARLLAYFQELEGKHGIKTADGQRRWYAAKEKTLADKMLREYPSHPDEAFAQAVKGAYYATQFAKIYAEGRICPSMRNTDAAVFTAWDIGVGDSTAIWFYQRIGKEIHLVDYYENSGEGLAHYFKVLKDKGFTYGAHYGPHDIENRVFAQGAKSTKQLAEEGYVIDGEVYSLAFEVVPKGSIDTGIELVRELLGRCVFDEETCEGGITHLENYRRAWNETLGCFRDNPLHDAASHCADAFRYLATIELGVNEFIVSGTGIGSAR